MAQIDRYYHGEVLLGRCVRVERRATALRLALAAVIAPNVYDLGELVSKTILNRLQKQEEVLNSTVFLFNVCYRISPVFIV